jgi:hypothetical protein
MSQINNFNIIKFRGNPNSVTLMDGTVVRNNKEEFIYVPEYGGMVRKAPYDNQFVFEIPKRIKGPSHMCSCGSIGVFVGTKAYNHLGSASGMMLVCHSHTTTGKHADGSS